MPKIALIGRQNVGKSTLFNALLRKRESIEYDMPGVTRDLIAREVDWGEGGWQLIDFPGFESKKEVRDDPLKTHAIERAMNELENCHLLLWVISMKGLSSFEKNLAEELQKIKQKVWLIVNFVDDPSLENEASEFYSLGFENIFFVSALNKRNIRELREKIIKHFSGFAPEVNLTKSDDLNIAIVGKPNAGKSTLFNFLLKKEKAITSNIPGTTRDCLKETFPFYGRGVSIVDTAGLRKKNKVTESVEFFSMSRTEEAARLADVIVLVIDPVEGLDRQNKNIISLIEKLNKPLIIAVNKSDIYDIESLQRNKILSEAKQIEKIFWKIPLFFISSLDGKNIPKVLEKAFNLKEKRLKKTSTPELNNLLEEIKKNRTVSSRSIGANYITRAHPETKFILFASKNQIPDNIKKYIQNVIKKHFDIEDLPIYLDIRKKN
ncbi:MAG: ribosome biogenesis GTPase Der [Spirochaetia bacterium]|nr:ribosome biogenesis GTPase Der [Spirochaetia bacterium]